MGTLWAGQRWSGGWTKVLPPPSASSCAAQPHGEGGTRSQVPREGSVAWGPGPCQAGSHRAPRRGPTRGKNHSGLLLTRETTDAATASGAFLPELRPSDAREFQSLLFSVFIK